MTGFDPKRWRPAPLLPEGGGTRALLLVVATLCFLACLTAIGVLAAERASGGWIAQLGGEATVIVRPVNGQTPDAAAARAAEVLAGVNGVSEARALEPKKVYDLIRPWLGDISDIQDLPVPRMVTVTLDSKSPATAASLGQALQAAGLDASVDDHRLWIRDIRRSADVARSLGAGVFLVIAAAAAAAVAFATQAGLATRRDVVEVLHLSGAEDGYIAGLFQGRFVRLAVIGGVAGAAGAAAVGA
ncbi:MAG: ABC transporter permease, partial [Alphaproteobacteria bacterium]|nr:ABC transporter permease [Alphaproteobacteria bacterium]